MSSILIVEDEPNIRAFVSVNLEVRGYEVYEAGDGKSAMELLNQRSPSLLILDLMLPDTTGWNILETMAEQENLKNIPVILMTALSGGVAQPDAVYPNLALKLVKPVSVDEILNAVDHVLQG
jgi:DNA-binding response OmpR family regulator